MNFPYEERKKPVKVTEEELNYMSIKHKGREILGFSTGDKDVMLLEMAYIKRYGSDITTTGVMLNTPITQFANNYKAQYHLEITEDMLTNDKVKSLCLLDPQLLKNLQNIENLSIELNDTCNASGITRILEQYFCAVHIYIYDSTSETLRNFSRSWVSIEESAQKDKTKKLYKIFEKLKNTSYTIEDNKLFYALYQGQKPIGMLEFERKPDDKTFEFLKIARASHIFQKY